MNAGLQQTNYPYGNFSDTSNWTFLKPEGSIGHVFKICIRTEKQNQSSCFPLGPHEISVLIELTLGHLRSHLAVSYTHILSRLRAAPKLTATSCCLCRNTHTNTQTHRQTDRQTHTHTKKKRIHECRMEKSLQKWSHKRIYNDSRTWNGDIAAPIQSRRGGCSWWTVLWGSHENNPSCHGCKSINAYPRILLHEYP